MAKGLGLFGNFAGKVGNIVGYQLKNSSNNVTQGVRTYVAEVANPKTEAQATQRMKMTAAVNFYRLLTEVLNNAWQSEKYGTKSRNYFMKLAMTQTEGIPFVEKGDKHFYPGAYPVSQGSLPTQSVTAISADLADTSLSVGADFVSDGATFGDFSQALINNSFGVLQGDKVTFIGVGEVNGEYSPMYSYFIVNTESDTSLADVISSSKMRMQFTTAGNVRLGFEQLSTEVAAAVIISRYPQTGSSWLRSSSTLFISEAYRNTMMSAARFAQVAASYIAAGGSLTSDWYLNRGLTGGDVVENYAGDSNLSITNVQTQSVANLALSNDTTGSANVALVTLSNGRLYVATGRNSWITQTAIVANYNLSTGVAQANSPYGIANAANLATIRQAVTNDIAGYYNVSNNVDTGSTPVENRP